MRIRKRPVLFPPSLSPLHLSDPHLISRSPVVVQLSDDTSTVPELSSSASASAVLLHHHAAASSLDRCQPSDQPLPSIGKRSNGSDDPSGIGESGAPRQHNKQDPLDEVVRRGESGEDSGEKGNHSRKGRTLGLETQVEVLPQLSLSSTQDGRWYEGEKAIPLKKRRGSFEENNNSNNAASHSKKMKAKMKTKMNKKCSTTRNDQDSMGEEEESKVVVNVSKKRARGGALMEGSRCSRVNGRGWRCCQQTLVGYSLCEHHLGKGRLRSMTSVRSRSLATTTTTTTTAPPKKVHHHHHVPQASSPSSSSLEKQSDQCGANYADHEPFEEEEEKKPKIMTTTTTKKRMKLGMVKARSISSLLGQTNTQIAAVGHENNSK